MLVKWGEALASHNASAMERLLLQLALRYSNDCVLKDQIRTCPWMLAVLDGDDQGIHAALINTGTDACLANLLKTFVETNPLSMMTKDFFSQLPLHLAVRCNLSSAILKVLLAAFPDVPLRMAL